MRKQLGLLLLLVLAAACSRADFAPVIYKGTNVESDTQKEEEITVSTPSQTWSPVIIKKSKESIIASTQPKDGDNAINAVKHDSCKDTISSVTDFSLPLKGDLVRAFGTDADGRNNGIEIGATSGELVRAAASGKVRLITEATSELGTIVFIEHNGRWSTVYGRLGEVRVQQGAQVSCGDEIGTLSEARAPHQAALYFEIRQGIKAIDPTPLL